MQRVGRALEFHLKTMLLTPVPLRDEFVMVTGADRTHFKSLCNLLRSAAKWEPGMRCIVFDLGLEPDQRSALAAEFPAREVRRFDYSRYPDYFNIRVNAGEYAWKPVIFSEVFEECRCGVAWLDAGDLLYEPLHWMRKVVQVFGFYSPLAKGSIAEWTHPATLAYLKASPAIGGKPNLAGYCVAANYRSLKARRFVERWKECALIRECIAPPGSSRYNHRQDMSVLSIPPDAPAVVPLAIPPGL
jgi:hypothetical protein